MAKTVLSVREAAKALNVCIQRIHTKIRMGDFKSIRRCECQYGYVIDKAEIDQEIALRKQIAALKNRGRAKKS